MHFSVEWAFCTNTVENVENIETPIIKPIDNTRCDGYYTAQIREAIESETNIGRKCVLGLFHFHSKLSDSLPTEPESNQLGTLSPLIESRLLLVKEFLVDKAIPLLKFQESLVRSMLIRAQIRTLEILDGKPESLLLEIRPMMEEMKTLFDQMYYCPKNC
ncbi:hypothetical protein FACS1894122_11790 [Alphaproteobacteria bacterium]|nr:hypothetical protein FACS1894122_11790 [Alphaproteobacteria bacterium]